METVGDLLRDASPRARGRVRRGPDPRRAPLRARPRGAAAQRLARRPARPAARARRDARRARGAARPRGRRAARVRRRPRTSASANTWGAKGVFPWDSPHHLGTCGLQARRLRAARASPSSTCSWSSGSTRPSRRPSATSSAPASCRSPRRPRARSPTHVARLVVPARATTAVRAARRGRAARLRRRPRPPPPGPRGHGPQAVAWRPDAHRHRRPGRRRALGRPHLPHRRTGHASSSRRHDRPGIAAAVALVVGRARADTATAVADRAARRRDRRALVELAATPRRCRSASRSWGDDVDLSLTGMLVDAAGPVVAWTS